MGGRTLAPSTGHHPAPWLEGVTIALEVEAKDLIWAWRKAAAATETPCSQQEHEATVKDGCAKSWKEPGSLVTWLSL